MPGIVKGTLKAVKGTIKNIKHAPTYKNVRGITEAAQKAVGAPASELESAYQKATKHYGLGVNAKRDYAEITEAAAKREAEAAARAETSSTTARNAGSNARRNRTQEIIAERNKLEAQQADQYRNYIEADEASVFNEQTDEVVNTYRDNQRAEFLKNYRSPAEKYANSEELKSAITVDSSSPSVANIKWDTKGMSANELEMQATEAALENSGKITSTEVQKEQMRRWSITPGDGMKIETNKPFVPSKTYNVGTPESANGLINTGDEFNIPVVATDGFSPEMLKTDRYSGIATHPRTYSNKYTYENIDRNGYIKPALSKEQMKLQYGSPPVNEDAPWANGMKIALGTAVTGAALCAALSSSRGQQNNAQLYGQQPLY